MSGGLAGHPPAAVAPPLAVEIPRARPGKAYTFPRGLDKEKIGSTGTTVPMTSTLPTTLSRGRLSIFVASFSLAAGSLSADDFSYTVRAGDNPWNLTQRYLKSVNYWPRVQDYNSIVDPTAMRPGTRLLIPLSWMRGLATVAQVADLRGHAELLRGRESTPVKPGLTVAIGDSLRTAADSTLTLEFADGSRSLVGPDSELRLTDLRRLKASAAQQVRIELPQGHLENHVTNNRRNGGRFVIDTPAAVAAVRGTRFRVAASNKDMRSETLGGEVLLQNHAGRRVLPAGTGSLVRDGGAPTPAVALLPAPRLDHLPARVERLPLALEFPALPGAVRYRTQIAPATGFSVLASDTVSHLPRTSSSTSLPDGRYRLRVRGIDANGLEGLDAEREIELDARPEPPFPSLPPPDGFVVDEHIEFRWSASSEAARYRFQLAGDDSFGSPLLDQDQLEQATFTVTQALPPGRYFWRVAMRTAAEGQGPFSDPQRFQRPPPGPLPETPSIAGDTLELRWRAAAPGDRYQVQISRQADFSEPEVDLQTSQAAISVERPAAGVHHVRIRTLAPGDPPGPWGRPQQIEVPRDWRSLMLLLPALLILAL